MSKIFQFPIRGNEVIYKKETERKKRYVSPYLDDLESQPKSVELFRVVDAVQSDAPGVVEVGVVFS